MSELDVRSAEACANILFVRLGLTDSAIAVAAKVKGCSVLTNDSALYSALAADGFYVAMFNHFRQFL